MPRKTRRKLRVPKTTSAQARALQRAKKQIDSLQRKYEDVRRELSDWKAYRSALAKRLTG